MLRYGECDTLPKAEMKPYAARKSIISVRIAFRLGSPEVTMEYRIDRKTHRKRTDAPLVITSDTPRHVGFSQCQSPIGRIIVAMRHYAHQQMGLPLLRPPIVPTRSDGKHPDTASILERKKIGNQSFPSPLTRCKPLLIFLDFLLIPLYLGIPDHRRDGIGKRIFSDSRQRCRNGQHSDSHALNTPLSHSHIHHL